MRKFLKSQLPAILWAGVIFWASSIPAHKLPRFVLLFNDKSLHAATFFILGLLVYNALEPITTVQWKRIFIVVVGVSIYGILDEFHQTFVPGRTVDARDAAADALGGLLAALAIYLWRSRRK